MHTNPIAHWSGAAAPVGPLLNLDYRTPRESPHPANQAEVLALGLPAATALWNCQEVAGNITDKIGAVHLVNVAGVQGQRASGIFWNNNFTGDQKKAIEGTNGSVTTRFTAALAADLDVGLLDMAMWVEFRCKTHLMTLARYIASKFDSVALTGYRLRLSNVGVMTFQAYDGAAAITPGVTDARFVDGGWHRALCILDRTAGFVRLITEYGTQSLAIGALGSIATGAFFSLLAGSTASSTSASIQISECILWIGAGVTGMGAAEFNILNADHGVDPNPVPLDVHACASLVSDLCGYTAGFGVHLADWSTNLLPIAWNPRLNGGAGGLGLGVWRAAASLITESDDFTLVWVPSGTCTTSKAAADLDDSPRGMEEACRLTVAAGAGYIEHQSATAALTRYTFDVFVKRHSTAGADVNCNLEMYNVTGGVSVATQAFVATADWQHIPINGGAFITPGGITAQLRIYIDDNGRSIHAFRAHAVQDTRDPFIAPYTSAGVVTESSTTYQTAASALAGEWMKGAKGEIEATLVTSCAVLPIANNATVLDTDDAAAGNNDKRIERFDATQHGEGLAYTNVGALADTVDSGVAIDASVVETDLRYQWDAANPSLGGRHSRLIINAVEYLGAVAGWAHSDLVKKLWLGVNDSAIEPLQGVMSRLRFFDQT